MLLEDQVVKSTTITLSLYPDWETPCKPFQLQHSNSNPWPMMVSWLMRPKGLTY